MGAQIQKNIFRHEAGPSGGRLRFKSLLETLPHQSDFSPHATARWEPALNIIRRYLRRTPRPNPPTSQARRIVAIGSTTVGCTIARTPSSSLATTERTSRCRAWITVKIFNQSLHLFHHLRTHMRTTTSDLEQNGPAVRGLMSQVCRQVTPIIAIQGDIVQTQ